MQVREKGILFRDTLCIKREKDGTCGRPSVFSSSELRLRIKAEFRPQSTGSSSGSRKSLLRNYADLSDMVISTRPPMRITTMMMTAIKSPFFDRRFSRRTSFAFLSVINRSSMQKLSLFFHFYLFGSFRTTNVRTKRQKSFLHPSRS